VSTKFYTPPQFTPPYEQPPSPPPFTRLILPAALLTLGAVLVLGAAGVAIAFYNKADWTLTEEDLYRYDLIESVQDNWDLPAHEEAGVIAQINRVFDAEKNGQITFDQCDQVFTELLKTPHFAILAARDFDEYLVPKAELRRPERRAATRTVERAVRGLLRDRISRDEFYAALPKIYSFDDRFTQKELDEMDDEEYDRLFAEEPDPTPDEIRESLVKLKALADREEIPDEPFQADFALEMTKVVDRLLPVQRGK
jgi:hypothetical protein